jgi:hypothetical protein
VIMRESRYIASEYATVCGVEVIDNDGAIMEALMESKETGYGEGT